MPDNLLFWIVAAVGALAAGSMAWVRRRGEQGRATRQGRVPGYSFTPGSELAMDESAVDMAREHWSIRGVETMHSASRARVIVGLHLETVESAQATKLLEQFAREIYRRCEAHVVLIEATTPGSKQPFQFLFAPDGRGWWGGEPVTTALRGPDVDTRWA